MIPEWSISILLKIHLHPITTNHLRYSDKLFHTVFNLGMPLTILNNSFALHQRMTPKVSIVVTFWCPHLYPPSPTSGRLHLKSSFFQPSFYFTNVYLHYAFHLVNSTYKANIECSYLCRSIMTSIIYSIAAPGWCWVFNVSPDDHPFYMKANLQVSSSIRWDTQPSCSQQVTTRGPTSS